MSVIEAGMVARHRRSDATYERIGRYVGAFQLVGWGFVLGLIAAAVML